MITGIVHQGIMGSAHGSLILHGMVYFGWAVSQIGKLFRLNLFYKSLSRYSLNKAVTSFAEDKEHILWIGSDSGLIRLDDRNRTKRVFVHDSLNASSLSEDHISSIDSDPSDNLWIGTYSKGLNRFDRATQSFIHYRHDIKNKNSLINDSVVTVHAGKEQNLWIGTNDGLDLMNTKTGSISHYQNNPKDSNGLSHNNVFGIIEDKQGNLWVACENAAGLNRLNKLDPATGKSIHYLEGENISGIYEDNDNIVWVGTYSGLYKFNPGSGLFSKLVNPSTGEDFSFVYSITGDNQKNIWLGSASGIIKFNYIQNECITYKKNGEGTILNNFLSAYKGNDGQLFSVINMAIMLFSLKNL